MLAVNLSKRFARSRKNVKSRKKKKEEEKLNLKLERNLLKAYNAFHVLLLGDKYLF